MSLLDKRIAKEGFTLIELLIVVALVGVLSGIVVSVINVSGLRAKTRDSNRVADLEKIKVALDLYYSDNRGFPLTGDLDSLAPIYMAHIPMDPSTGADYCYASDGVAYVLAASMEIDGSVDDSPCDSLTAWTSPLDAVCSGVSRCYGVESLFGTTTASSGGSCGAASCPTGCCAGGVCHTPPSSTYCGTGGAVCVACGAGQSCVGGSCTSAAVCNASNCSGCCIGATCYAGDTNSRCGTGGSACVACGAGQSCVSGSCTSPPVYTLVQIPRPPFGLQYFRCNNFCGSRGAVCGVQCAYPMCGSLIACRGMSQYVMSGIGDEFCSNRCTEDVPVGVSGFGPNRRTYDGWCCCGS